MIDTDVEVGERRVGEGRWEEGRVGEGRVGEARGNTEVPPAVSASI